MTGLREQKKAQTRAVIVAEAGRLFAARGFQATTMGEIAAAAGVSAATLYNYFGTKNALLLAHVESTVGEMMDAGSAVLADPPADIVAAVHSLTTVFLDHFVGLERELLREVFAAGFAPSSELLPELIRLDELLIGQLAMLLRQFGAPGGLAPGIEVDEAVVAIYSLLVTQLIMYLSVEERTADALRHSLKRQIEIVFSGLRVRER